MKRLPASLWIPVVASLLGLAAMLLLAYFWHSASHHLGRFYAVVRVGETLGAWRWTEWGAYFHSRPIGQPYAFLAIFKSSVPFGVVFAALTGIIGVLAYRKVRTQHLDVLLVRPPGGFTAKSAVKSLHGFLPHLRADTLKIPTRPLRLPTRNPFAAVVDLRDRAQVSDVVADLSWPETATFILTLDAIAPMKSRTRIEHVSRTVWQTTPTAPAKGGATVENKAGVEPSKRDRAMMTLTLIDVVTRMDNRPVSALDDAHEKMRNAVSTHDALSELTVLAQKSRLLSLRETVWLRFADPLLHDRIAHAGLGSNA